MADKELNLSERISLLEILPEEGNFLTLVVLRDLKALIGIKEEEFKEYDIKQTQGAVTWNDEGKKPVKFKIGDKAEEIVRETLLNLDSRKKLNERHLSLYEKFVGKLPSVGGED